MAMAAHRSRLEERDEILFYHLSILFSGLRDLHGPGIFGISGFL